MHGTAVYESFSDCFSVVSVVTAVLQSDAVSSIDVTARITIRKSPCSNFKNMHLVARSSYQNRSSKKKAFIYFY